MILKFYQKLKLAFQSGKHGCVLTSVNNTQWVQTSIKSTSKDVTFPVSGTVLYAGASNNGSALTPSYAAMPVSAGVVRFTPSAWDPSGSNAILAVLISK